LSRLAAIVEFDIVANVVAIAVLLNVWTQCSRVLLMQTDERNELFGERRQMEGQQ